MSFIQTLVNFLSLKTRSEHFPKAKVSGGISRTLAIMNGLAPGGVRTCQVDSAGQLLVRPIDLNDMVNVATGDITDTQWHEIGICNLILFEGVSYESASIRRSVAIRLGADGSIKNVPLHMYTAFWQTPRYWCFFHGQIYASFDRIKAISAYSGFRFSYSAFKFPER